MLLCKSHLGIQNQLESWLYHSVYGLILFNSSYEVASSHGLGEAMACVDLLKTAPVRMVHPVKQARLRCSAEQGEVPLYILPSGLLVFSEITLVRSAEVRSTPVDPQKTGLHTSGSYHFCHPLRSSNNYGC